VVGDAAVVYDRRWLRGNGQRLEEYPATVADRYYTSIKNRSKMLIRAAARPLRAHTSRESISLRSFPGTA
jgi:hypothetical protein